MTYSELVVVNYVDSEYVNAVEDAALDLGFEPRCFDEEKLALPYIKRDTIALVSILEDKVALNKEIRKKTHNYKVPLANILTSSTIETAKSKAMFVSPENIIDIMRDWLLAAKVEKSRIAFAYRPALKIPDLSIIVGPVVLH